MAEITVNKIKSIALLGHSAAGKTSLMDTIAYKLGVSDRLGKVEEKTSLSDYDEEEKKRGISINLSVFSIDKDSCRLNFIDVPGYLEFIGEGISGVRASDIGLILVNAHNGIEIGTEKAWDLLEARNLPRAFLINKIDEENVDIKKIVFDIRQRFGKNCVLVEVPDQCGPGFKNSVSLLETVSEASAEYKQALVESIAESKDDLLEKYLENGSLPDEQLKEGLKNAIAAGKVIPIFCGSGKSESYVENLANNIIKYFPSCSGTIKMEPLDENDDKKILLEPKEDAPFVAQVFKTVIDPYIGQLSIFKVFSGTLVSNSSHIYNCSYGSEEKIGQIYFLNGKEQKNTDKVIAGDIAAVAKLKNADITDTITDGSLKNKIAEMKYPGTSLSASIKPHSREDEKKISEALKKLEKEDKTFKISRDSQTKELIISGMGSLHLEIMVDRLRDRFGVSVDVGTPKVPYKETISDTVQVHHKYKKQSGGRGQYGDVWLKLVPVERGKGFEFEDQITGGAIPRQYIPAVEKGVKNAMQKGVIAGYPIVDIKVILYDGSYHNVDSSDMAFQIAGSMALKEGVVQAKPILLEPIMEVSIFVEEEFMGQINKDISSRRGRIMGMEAKGKIQAVNAEVPLSEMLQYVSELKSMTGGRGSFSMEFSRYEPLPHKLAEKIIAEKPAEE